MFTKKNFEVVWMTLAMVAGGTAAYMTNACDPYDDSSRTEQENRARLAADEAKEQKLIRLRNEVEARLIELRPRIQGAIVAGACDLAVHQLQRVAELDQYGDEYRDLEGTARDQFESTGLGWDAIKFEPVQRLMRDYWGACAFPCTDRVTLRLGASGPAHFTVNKDTNVCVTVEAAPGQPTVGGRVRLVKSSQTDPALRILITRRFEWQTGNTEAVAVLDLAELPFEFKARLVRKCDGVYDRCTSQEAHVEDVGAIEINLSTMAVTAPPPAAQAAR